jgi:hypothetical protein
MLGVECMFSTLILSERGVSRAVADRCPPKLARWDHPHDGIRGMDTTRRDPAYRPSVAEWWLRYTAEEPELFRRFVATFERARSGTMSRDSLQAEIGQYWLAGYVFSRLFRRRRAIRSDLSSSRWRIITGRTYGMDGAFTAMRDPRELLLMYAKAVKARPTSLQHCFVLPDSIGAHARALLSQ